MHSDRRSQYLEAIGIGLWVPRGGRAAAPVPPPPPAMPGAAAPGELAMRWEALRSEVLRCTRCPLHATRIQGVFGVGPTRADWLVIGEAPGADHP
ncbi:MAG: hypothetical protein ACRETS_04305 [Steroidobacteraceae bacterium]